jgi:hypothetical protein
MVWVGLGVPPGLLGSPGHGLGRVGGTRRPTWEYPPAYLGVPPGLLGSREFTPPVSYHGTISKTVNLTIRVFAQVI